MRVKLGLSHSEIMKSSWISVCLQSADFPYYQYKSKDKQVITDPAQAAAILGKYMKP